MTTTIDNRPDRQSPDVLTRALAQVYTLNWEVITYVVIFAMAVFTRFYMLGERVMSHDESLHTRYSYNLASEGNFQHTPLMHGPVLFHMTALFYFLFGANDFTSRLYAAILGVIVVMMPILFRRWLGRWGALLASIMLLISPITMYYNRYIRHDTPNIFFSLVMIYGMFMYLSGPDAQRRRAHWLYIIAGAMVLNLGSKETAFIYVFIIGIYLALYWFVRLLQHFRGIDGKWPFYFIMMAFGVGGVAALGMYVTLSINLGERPFFEAFNVAAPGISEATFLSWTIIVIIAIFGMVAPTVINGFRNGRVRLGVGEGMAFFFLSFLVTTVLIIAEEISRIPSDETAEATEGATEVVEAGISVLPVVGAWGVAALIIGVMIVTWRRGLWDLMKKQFPEFDLLILIGSLILPWAAPLIIKFAGVHMTVQDINAYSIQEIQIVVASLVAMFAVSIAAGVLWDWKKWLISSVIFYALFAFFFTTMFTNGRGVATGIVGSLGYWLEQQGVRRGNQPQYYYLGVILPMYEYLPMIGSISAMFGGLTWFWRFRSNQLDDNLDQREQALEAIVTEENTYDEMPKAEHEDDNIVMMESDDVDDVYESELEAEADFNYDYDPLADPVDRTEPDVPHRSGELHALPFLPFVAWWSILNLIAYTLAGEKMPWLAIHMALPMILLTGWFFGRIFDRIDFKKFLNMGWLYLLVMPLFFVLVVRLIGPFLIGQSPFAGLQQESLRQTGSWLAVAAVLVVVAIGIAQLIERTGVAHFRRMTAAAFFAFMSILTFRAAWMASFINFDLANEYLVYAHAAPAVKLVLDDIEELSRKTTDGLDLVFLYDNEVSWPYSWYFRDYENARFVGSSLNAQQVDEAVVAVVGEANRDEFEPLLEEERFYRYEYIRLWWPMQDYFNMTPDRLANTWDFTGENAATAAQTREGLWNIWWNRDYDVYAGAVGRDFALTNWPVSDRMHFYVRKDFAAQIWDLGVGDGTVPGLTAADVNVCNANWQPIEAEVVFQSEDTSAALINPIGVAVHDGRVYVAQQGRGSIGVFTIDGEFVETFGVQGSAINPDDGLVSPFEDSRGLLERPNSVSTDDEGNIYVADTWNFRVQVFSPEGEPLNAWGSREESGAEVQIQPLDGFWGPRDVMVAFEKVYVADTGNKRIRVYDLNGEYRYDIGSAGSSDGQLNEPAGLAAHPDGRVFVADTWNRRVAVFDELGQFMYNFRVRAWYSDRGNRPYLAVDPMRGYIYVTDPEAGRILVHTLDGECVGSFGQAASEGAPARNQFEVAGGIAVDENGAVYVADAALGRILRFEAFPLPEEPEEAVDSGALENNVVEVQLDTSNNEANMATEETEVE